jgi:hypothetical protein
VSPCQLPHRLIAQRYCDFLKTVLLGLLEDVPVAVRHDGPPTHFAEDIRQWLNSTYPGK